MMMCTRCKKRPAVVFVSGSTDAQQSQGYCLVCAKELGIKPVNDLMERDDGIHGIRIKRFDVYGWRYDAN